MERNPVFDCLPFHRCSIWEGIQKLPRKDAENAEKEGGGFLPCRECSDGSTKSEIRNPTCPAVALGAKEETNSKYECLKFKIRRRTCLGSSDFENLNFRTFEFGLFRSFSG